MKQVVEWNEFFLYNFINMWDRFSMSVSRTCGTELPDKVRAALSCMSHMLIYQKFSVKIRLVFYSVKWILVEAKMSSIVDYTLNLCWRIDLEQLMSLPKPLPNYPIIIYHRISFKWLINYDSIVHKCKFFHYNVHKVQFFRKLNIC